MRPASAARRLSRSTKCLSRRRAALNFQPRIRRVERDSIGASPSDTDATLLGSLIVAPRSKRYAGNFCNVANPCEKADWAQSGTSVSATSSQRESFPSIAHLRPRASSRQACVSQISDLAGRTQSLVYHTAHRRPRGFQEKPAWLADIFPNAEERRARPAAVLVAPSSPRKNHDRSVQSGSIRLSHGHVTQIIQSG